jgi:hypothetical protein
MKTHCIFVCLLLAACSHSSGAGYFETPRKSDLIPFAENGKYGFLDIRSGKWAIQPQFDYADDFSEGLAVALLAGKAGYVDQQGTWAIKPQYVGANPFSGGIAVVLVTTGKVDYITKSATSILTAEMHPGFVAFGPPTFAEGFGTFSTNGLLGYVDDHGRVTIPPAFERAEPFSGGMAHVMITGKWSFIDKSGGPREDINAIKVDGQLRFHEGLATASLFDNRSQGLCYIDPEGRTVIAPRFIQANRFSEGLAAVQGYEVLSNGMQRACLFGYIDRTGNYVIEPRFDNGGVFSDGVAAVNVNGRWGYIDKAGAIIVTPQFTAAAPFVHGLAVVALGEDLYCIDKHGSFIWGPKNRNGRMKTHTEANKAVEGTAHPRTDSPSPHR